MRTALVALTFFMAATSQAVTPAQLCQSAKNKEAGKYDYCRQTAESGFAKTGDNAKYTAALAKCLSKQQIAWPKLEAKAVAQGSVCPSTGDQVAIQGIIDQHTTNIATAVGGGVLFNCPADLAICQAAQQGNPLKTGQTVCYNSPGLVINCAGSGQDGESQKGLARSYTDNGDGTITDGRTGLVWEKLSDDGSIHDKDTTYTWTTAVTTKVATLNSGSFAGFNDWRLPNPFELYSLVNLGALNPSVFAAFNTSCAPTCTVLTCSCIQSSGYLSSATNEFSTADAWVVNFFQGAVGTNTKINGTYVRAVRGGS